MSGHRPLLTQQGRVWADKKGQANANPREVHDLGMDGGLPPGFQKGTLFQLPKLAGIPTFMMNFGGKPPIFDYFSLISG